MRFIHSADIHIDSPLSGLGVYDNAPVDLLRTATRSAFSQLVDRAIAERVAFVILAGDIFDGDWPDWNTGMFFVREMARLNEAGILVVVKRGNHDAELEQTRNLPLPPNVHVFPADRPFTFEHQVGDVKIAFHGQSYAHKATVDNLAGGYPAPLPGRLNIGVLHTGIEGHKDHASYAPCSLEQLRQKGYDYWALGHIHLHQVHHETPWIVMPGNLQGRHIRETGPRGAMLVTCEQGELRRPERVYVDVVRWALVEVDITEAATREEAVARATKAFEQTMEAAEGRPVACRLVLTGKSKAHGQLFGQEQTLRAELTAQAVAVGGDDLWIEKIMVKSQPALDEFAIAAGGDALAELQKLLARAATDEELATALRVQFATLVVKMPPDIFEQDVQALKAVRDGNFVALVEEVAPSLLNRIVQEA